MSDQGQGHYSTVVRSMAEGRVVPLLGAGVNLASRPRGKAWKQGQYLPNGYELAKYLAGMFPYPEQTDLNLLRVSQYIVATQGLGPLYDELRKLFNENYPATPVHEFFAKLPAQAPRARDASVPGDRDHELRRRARARVRRGRASRTTWSGTSPTREPRGKFWHRPPGAAEPNVIDRPNAYDGLALDERTVILKIHGAVDRSNPERDSYVITEDHYIDYLTKTDIGQLIPAELLVKLTREPVPLPRLQHAGLEPAGDPPPDLGAAAALVQVLGDPEEPERDRAGALGGARRRRVRHPAAEVRRRSYRGARASPTTARRRRHMTVAAPPSHASPSRRRPYVGLTPFTERDAPFFFGREKERRIISANLLASRLTLLYGASGVGKSSIIRAGVQRDFRTARGQGAGAQAAFPESIVVVFTGWRDDPVAGLADCVAASRQGAARRAGADAAAQRSSGSTTCSSSGTGCSTRRRWSTPARRPTSTSRSGPSCSLIFDQFEQYFVYHGDEDGPDTFAVQFPQAVNREDLRASFLISLREDAYTQLDRFEGRILNLFAGNLRVEHLDEKAATAAIVRPVETYNELLGNGDPPFEVEPALVEAVIDAGAGREHRPRPGRRRRRRDTTSTERASRVETPFLQLVMSRLWSEEERRHSHVLRPETLEASAAPSGSSAGTSTTR